MIDDEAALIEGVRDRTYPAGIERVIRIDANAWDLNCGQHVPKLVPQQHLNQSVADCDVPVAPLQAPLCRPPCDGVPRAPRDDAPP
jgi:hypothetical protein